MTWGKQELKERFSNVPCLSITILCGFCLLTPPAARAQTAGQTPKLLRDVGIDQKLNDEIPLELPFQDETGRTVLLRDYFGNKPVILALVYYQCPMLCTEVLNGLLRSMKTISLDAGKDFSVVTVSFNPKETPELAANKKKVYAGLYARPGAGEGWHFLTGPETSIQALTKAVGYRYAFDAQSGQYAHASGIMVLTPEGKLSRYFYGIEYPSRDLRLGLVEASSKKIGSPADELLLFCFHYDPKTGKYGLLIQRVIVVTGLGTILAMGTFMFVMFRREQYGRPERFTARNSNPRLGIHRG